MKTLKQYKIESHGLPTIGERLVWAETARDAVKICARFLGYCFTGAGTSKNNNSENEDVRDNFYAQFDALGVKGICAFLPKYENEYRY